MINLKKKYYKRRCLRYIEMHSLRRKTLTNFDKIVNHFFVH